MEREHFDEIVESLESIRVNQRSPSEIPLEKRIAIALYTMGSSKDYRKVGRLFGVPSSMIPKILNEFCRQIINVFAPEHLPKEFLTQEKLEECIQGFEELGFPQCFGVLGKNTCYKAYHSFYNHSRRWNTYRDTSSCLRCRGLL